MNTESESTTKTEKTPEAIKQEQSEAMSEAMNAINRGGGDTCDCELCKLRRLVGPIIEKHGTVDQLGEFLGYMITCKLDRLLQKKIQGDLEDKLETLVQKIFDEEELVLGPFKFQVTRIKKAKPEAKP